MFSDNRGTQFILCSEQSNGRIKLFNFLMLIFFIYKIITYCVVKGNTMIIVYVAEKHPKGHRKRYIYRNLN